MDVVANATFLDTVQDYSAGAVQMTLQRFGSIYGWPEQITSDPGSQLVSAAGQLESWWPKMEMDLLKFAVEKGFSWTTSPADAPWRQGKCESRINKVKRLMRITHGDSELSPEGLQTSLYKIADLCNKIPLTVQRSPDADGTFKVVRPCDLLQGRSEGETPDMEGEGLKDTLIKRNLIEIYNRTRRFYKDFALFASPKLIWKKKWRVEPQQQIQQGDIVHILEPGKFKNSYKLAVVKDMKKSNDGKFRTAVLEYTIPRKVMCAEGFKSPGRYRDYHS